MAYGEKFSLLFSDVYNNPRKLSILQKNYSGAVFPLIGTDNPVVIKWDNNDDFYNPIIGSTCEINLFVTESTGGTGWDELDENWNLSEFEWDESTATSGTNYDNWYEADEREYKVQISTGDVSGSPLWDSITDQWQTSAVDWDDPSGQGFEFYWEGFIVVDRFQEAFTTTPYPIKLVASDGLGLLDGYDAPNSNIVLSGSSPSQTTQSNFDQAFYYVYKILQNTGLDFDIFVANSIRGQGFLDSDDKTILNDIELFEYGVLTNSNLNLNAKDLLVKILKSVNSRIFQSQGRWYIMSNSNLLDNRIYQSQETTVSTPIVQNIHITTTENIPATIELNGFDADGLSLTWSIVDDVTFGSTSISGSTVTFTPNTDFVGIDFFTFTASNGTNTSVTAFVGIAVNAAPEQSVTPGAFVVTPYNVRPYINVYFGNNITESLSRAKGVARYFSRTHRSFILDQISSVGSNRLFAPSHRVPTDFSRSNFGISVGAGQSNGSDQNSWRWAQVGTKMVWYLVPANQTGSSAFDYGYRVSDNDNDPTIPGTDPLAFTTFKFPRTPDFDNAVFSLPNGFYSFYEIPFINNNGFFTQYKQSYSTALGINFNTMPQISSRNDYPQDLKDVISSFGSNYIITVRIEDDFVVERYQFASY
tara:strand:- start:4235 stop:6166 length:1932 start_codon:yes stop_codon:yes gene_type:complete